MENSLINRIFAATSLAALLTAALPLSALAPVKATVPFAFEAGNVKLPAGTYIVSRSSNGHSITVESVGKPGAIMLPVINSGNVAASKSPRLVFERLGDHYRLSDVKVAGGVESSSIARDKKQSLVAKQMGSTSYVEVALN
ncbi:MAG: hypothetical protein ABI693_12695 [Bryobacteraceae bacterium]